MEGEGTTSVVGGPCDSLQVVGLHSGTMGHGSLVSRPVGENARSPLNAGTGTIETSADWHRPAPMQRQATAPTAKRCTDPKQTQHGQQGG